jgi:hypothetical protein
LIRIIEGGVALSLDVLEKKGYAECDTCDTSDTFERKSGVSGCRIVPKRCRIVPRGVALLRMGVALLRAGCRMGVALLQVNLLSGERFPSQNRRGVSQVSDVSHIPYPFFLTC